MSKLIDKLNRVSQSASQPMGFGTTQSLTPRPKMLLIANLTKANVDSLADYVAGADGGLLHISQGSGVETLREVSQAISEIPWGWWLRDGGQREIDQIVKAGCDFVVFPATSTPLAIPQGNEIGRILQVEASLSADLLQAINDLPIDAVLVASEQGKDYFLTWHHLMLFRRFANLLTKPLLVSIPPEVTTNELQALREAGVDGVIVEVGIGQPAGKLNELRQAIDKLPTLSPRKRGKTEALLPRIAKETDLLPEEEEE